MTFLSARSRSLCGVTAGLDSRADAASARNLANSSGFTFNSSHLRCSSGDPIGSFELFTRYVYQLRPPADRLGGSISDWSTRHVAACGHSSAWKLPKSPRVMSGIRTLARDTGDVLDFVERFLYQVLTRADDSWHIRATQWCTVECAACALMPALYRASFTTVGN
jgi:hypothetical protein